MKTSDIERAISNKIKETITDLKVQAICDGKPDKRNMSNKGSVFVFYTGSKYAKSKLREAIYQDRVMFFEIYLALKGYADSNDSVDRLDAIRAILTGYRVNEKFEKIVPIEDEFLREDNGYWHWRSKYSFVAKNAEESMKNAI